MNCAISAEAMLATSARSPGLGRRRFSQNQAPVTASHSPPGHYRLTGRGASVSPLSSPPAGGATPSTPAVPYGGAITPATAPCHDEHSPNIRIHSYGSASSLHHGRIGNQIPVNLAKALPPTPRRQTPRMPKRTPRLSPRSSLVNNVATYGRRMSDEEEKRRRRATATAGAEAAAAGSYDAVSIRRSSSGSRSDGGGVPDVRSVPCIARGYPVVTPPTAVTAVPVVNGVSELQQRAPLTTLSGSTTPTDGGAEGATLSLYSRLRGNSLLQAPDSRIMRLIGKRSVLRAHNGAQAEVVRSKAKPYRCMAAVVSSDKEGGEALPKPPATAVRIVRESTSVGSRLVRQPPAAALQKPPLEGLESNAAQANGLLEAPKEEPRSESKAVPADPVAEEPGWPEKEGPIESLAQRAAAAVAEEREPAPEPMSEGKPKAYPESPRNYVAATIIGGDPDDGDGAIVWPGASRLEEEHKPEAHSIGTPESPPKVPQEGYPPAPVSEAVAALHAATTWPLPADLPLLQNEAGSVVAPQTWRFVPPPADQAPKPPVSPPKQQFTSSWKEATVAESSSLVEKVADAVSAAKASNGKDGRLPAPIQELLEDRLQLDEQEKERLVEQLVDCLFEEVHRCQKELSAEQRANRALKMSLEVEQRKALVYHQRLTELADQTARVSSQAPNGI